jgi:UDP-N-acetylglucosamine 2-epimerase (non-hydrolysing)
MSTMKVAVIAAERAAFVRAAPLIAELTARREFRLQFIFAGEDYVAHASSELFRDLGLPYADMVIGASEGTVAQRLAKVMVGCERLATTREPEAIILVGSSHVMLGCAVTCAGLNPILTHVDAGLRAPGLAGRTSVAAQIDRACDMLMAASEQAHDRLVDGGAPKDAVVLTGPLVCDAAARCLDAARAENAAQAAGLSAKAYALAIIEAPENVEHLANLRKVADVLTAAQERLPVALVMHPRLVRRLASWDLSDAILDLPQLRPVEPAGYVAYLSLLDSARIVFTDIGGVQDEATFLGVPCLTLAETTDRIATVESGGNLLVGLDLAFALQAVEALVTNEYVPPPLPRAWDGGASGRIADALVRAVAQRGDG